MPDAAGYNSIPDNKEAFTSLPATKTAHHAAVTLNNFSISPRSKCISFPRRQASIVPESQLQEIDGHFQVDKLVISQLGLLAQRRLARGVKLNHSEACVRGNFHMQNNVA
jgi:hypothetical protein